MLVQNPQLTFALFQAQLTLGMAKPPVGPGHDFSARQAMAHPQAPGMRPGPPGPPPGPPGMRPGGIAPLPPPGPPGMMHQQQYGVPPPPPQGYGG